MGSLAALIARFGLAGLINTAVGFSVVCLLDIVLKLPPAVANAGGYAVGIAVSFVLNRVFVFRSRTSAPSAGLRFLLAAALAFALNQVVLRLVGAILGAGVLQHLAAQALAMAVYSVSLFVLCRSWVFRPGAASDGGDRPAVRVG